MKLRNWLFLLLILLSPCIFAQDSFEPDDIPSLNSTSYPNNPGISNGVLQTHDFHQANESDWGISWMGANGVLEFRFAAVTNPGFDRWRASLYMSEEGSYSRTLVAQGTFGATSLRLRGQTRPAAGRLFWVNVTPVNSSFFGPGSEYTILGSVISGENPDSTEPNDLPSLNNPGLLSGVTRTFNFNQTNDADWSITWLTPASVADFDFAPVSPTATDKWYAQLFMSEEGSYERTVVGAGSFGQNSLRLRGQAKLSAGRLFWVRVTALDGNFVGNSTAYDVTGTTQAAVSADAFEADDQPSVGSPNYPDNPGLLSGVTQTHNFNQTNDHDWAIFWLGAGQSGTVNVAPSVANALNPWRAQLFYSEEGSFVRQLVSDSVFGVQSVSYAAAALPTAGRLFWLHVYPVNSNFVGAQSQYTMLTTLNGAVCTPTLNAPPILNNTNSLALTWTSAASCSTPTSYELRYGTAAAGPWTTLNLANVSAATILLPGSGTYYSNIRACIAANCSAYSANVQTVAATTTNVFATPSLPVLAAQPAVDTESDQVEALPGQMSVDESGAARYTLPIRLPPARGGFLPELALSYSSQAGEGELGRGFSVAGLSTITRCRQTKEHGDGNGPFPDVAFDNEKDRFCLDGQRLMLVSGNNGELNAEYRTEIDRFQKITVSAASNGQPLEFTVLQPSGAKQIFGGSSALLAGNSGSARLSWLFSSAQDASGNAIQYSYTINTADGSAKFTGLSYIGGSVTVQHEDLAAALKMPRYVGGVQFTRTSLIKSLTVLGRAGAVIEQYRFTLTPASKNRSHFRLTRIDRCKPGATEICVRPTILNWAPELDLSAAATSYVAGNWNDGKVRSVKAADLDGDGRNEVFDLSENTQLIYRRLNNTPRGLALGVKTSSGVAWNEDDRTDRYLGWDLIDLNNDGMSDLVHPYRQGTTLDNHNYIWVTRKSVGTSFLSIGGLIGAAFNHDLSFRPNYQNIVVFADIFGDGTPDFLTHPPVGAPLAGAQANQNTSGGLSFQPVVAFPNITGLLTGCSVSDRFTPARFRAFDANADGRSDLLLRVTGVGCDIAATTYSSGPHLGQESGSVKEPNVVLADNSFWVLALNESVLNQTPQFKVYATWKISGSNAVASDREENFRLVDLNGDNLVDVLYQRKNSTSWDYQLNTARLAGSGTVSPFAPSRCARYTNNLSLTCSSISDTDELEFVDYDGDGASDLWQPENSGGRNYRVFPWLGTQFASEAEFISTGYPAREGGEYRRLLTDLDGDTIPENFVVNAESSLIAGTQAPSSIGSNDLTRANRHHQPHNLLLSVDNGLGKTSRVEYALTTFSDTYRRDYSGKLRIGRAQSLVADSFAPDWVVKRIFEPSPTVATPTGTVSKRYRYVGQKTQAGGRGALGFRIIETLDEQRLIQTRTEYRQDFPFIGKANKVSTTLLPQAWAENCTDPDSASCMMRCQLVDASSGNCQDFDTLPTGAKLLSESATIYAQRISQSVPGVPLSGALAPIFVYSTNSSAKSYDLKTNCPSSVAGNACNERLLSTQNSAMSNFDDFGNAKTVGTDVSQHDAAATATTLQSSSESTDYENRTTGAPWQLGLVTKKTVTVNHAAPFTTLTRVQTMAYTPAGLLAETHVEPQFNGTALQGDSNLALTLHTYFAYDSFGNRLSTRSCSNHTALIANNGAECKATDASTSTAVPKNAVSPELWLRRFSFQAMDASNTFVATTYVPFDGSSGLGGIASSSSGFNDWGVPTVSVDANGVQTKTYTGTFGAPYASANSLGKLVTTRLRLCTNTAGRFCPSGARYFANMIDQSGPDSWSYFDALGRKILSLSESLKDANSTARYVAVQTGYDSFGREASSTQPYFAEGPSSASVGTAVSANSVFSTERFYDVLDRVTQSTNADGGVVTSDFDRFTTTTTLPTNVSGYAQTRVETRTALNEMASVKDAAGLVVSYSYRAGGELKSLSRPGTIANSVISTSMEYDTLGRKISMSDPDKGDYAYAYNAAGELLQERSNGANGTCAALTYDRLGRKRTRQDYANSSCSGAVEHSAAWTFDGASFGLGQLSSESASTRNVATVARSFSFDSFSRPDSSISTIGGVSYQSRAVFDQYSRPFQNFFKASTDALLETGEYFEYDNLGIGVATRDANGGTNGTVYSRVKLTDAYGNPVSEERNLGSTAMQVMRQFNPATGLTELIRAGTAANPSSVQYLDYRWDKTGNMEWRNDQSAGRTLYERFTYDAQQRLLTQYRGTNSGDTNTLVLNMGYNALGNITSRNSVNYSYGGNTLSCANNAGPHAANAVGTINYCFDSRGNQLKSSDGRELSYLAFDLPDLIKSSNAGVTATVGFEYGPNHERVVRKNYPNVYGVVGSANETTHYLGGAEVHRRASGVEVKRYVGGVIIVQTANGISKNYQWFDHQGSVVAVTNDAGVPVGTDAQMAYDAFGLRRETTGIDFGLSRLLSFNTQATTRHGYTGHEMVDEVGLIHMNGRMYDPRIARFIQADPMIQDPMNSQSLNRYSYVVNNPLNATDPTGMTAVGGFLSMLGSIFAADCPSCHYTPGSGGTFVGISQLGGQTVLNSITIPPGTVDSAFSNVGSEVIAPNPKNEYIDHYRLYNDAQVTLSVLQSDRPSKFFSAAELYEQQISAYEEMNYQKQFVDFGERPDVRVRANTAIATGSALFMALGPAGEPALAAVAARGMTFSEEMVTVYRGTDFGSELLIYKESGAVLSDAGRAAYEVAMREGASISDALSTAKSASQAAHEVQLSAWGDLNTYVQAHGAFGQEISVFGPRSMVSVTTDPLVATKFGSHIFEFQVPKSALTPQTLTGAGESEHLLINGFTPR